MVMATFIHVKDIIHLMDLGDKVLKKQALLEISEKLHTLLCTASSNYLSKFEVFYRFSCKLMTRKLKTNRILKFWL